MGNLDLDQIHIHQKPRYRTTIKDYSNSKHGVFACTRDGPAAVVFALYAHKLQNPLSRRHILHNIARGITLPPRDNRIRGMVGTPPTQHASATQAGPTL